MKFKVWLEKRMLRTVSDDELRTITKGEPYNSPHLGRVGLIPKDPDDEHDSHGYLRHYSTQNKRHSTKSRSWIIDADVPDEEIHPRLMHVDKLDPKYITHIRKTNEPGREKLRDASKFLSTYRRMFPGQ